MKKVILAVVGILAAISMLGCDAETEKNNDNSELNENSGSVIEINKEETNQIAKELFEKGAEKIAKLIYSVDFDYPRVGITEKIGETEYEKTNVLYSTVEKEYAEIFTDGALRKVLDMRFVDMDGYLGYSMLGGSGWDIGEAKVEEISRVNDEIAYNVILITPIYDQDTGLFEKNVEEEYNMTIKLVDGKYRIAEINYFID